MNRQKKYLDKLDDKKKASMHNYLVNYELINVNSVIYSCGVLMSINLKENY
jgi:hypothetical protein